MAYDPTKSAGQSSDSIDPSVLGMPFIFIIQKGSAEFDETHKNHGTKKIEGCKPGHLVFGSERVILEKPLRVVPVAQTAIYSEWKPRDAGGGFVGHQPLSVIDDRNYRKGVKGSPNESKEYLGNNELIYTVYVMLLFLQGNTWKKGMISFQSTQLKHARNWLKTIASVKIAELPDVKPPIFAASYLLKTAIDQNAKGSWYSWDIQLEKVLSLTQDEVLLTVADAASSAALLTLPRATTRHALPAPGNATESLAEPY